MNAETELWYDTPARTWEEELPLGNGTLGAMIRGGIRHDCIHLNEDSLWYGGRRNRINPDAAAAMPRIRQALHDGHIQQAERLATDCLTGTPPHQAVYSTLGTILIDQWFSGESATTNMFYDYDHDITGVSGYRRSLDLTTAIHTISYTVHQTTYRKTAFTSYPDQVLAIQLEADGPEPIQATISLQRERNLQYQKKIDDQTISFGTDGHGDDEIGFCGMLTASSDDGEITVQGNRIVISNATAVTLLFTARTTFRNPDTERWCRTTLKQARTYRFQQLQERHRADYQRLFTTLQLNIAHPHTSLETLPTNQRLAALQSGDTADAAGLVLLYFWYGRYLLIASSRPGSLPANLQGIWNKDYFPMWDSKFTVNINTQMNYWAAEASGLSECTLPLFDLLTRLDDSGRTTARDMYRLSGFVCHHNTDIWADTAPQDEYLPASYWTLGGAWLCLHLWEHYQYTRDTAFLKEHFYILEDAVAFCNGYLTENDAGFLVASPSVSPENTYRLPDGTTGQLCAGCAMDSQILTCLYQAYLAAADVLGPAADLNILQRARYVATRLPPVQVSGRTGTILEWLEDYEETDPGHRHISHLFFVYPGKQLNPAKDKQLLDAARKTLERRLAYNSQHIGWSRAWMINLWARILDGESTWQNILALLTQSTYPNLMDKHPLWGDAAVFQIDGNFGAVNGILQMLVQETADGEVLYLPALPDAFADGSICGLRLTGNRTVNMEWHNKTITSFTIL